MSFIVAGVMCFFLCYLANYRTQQERELDDMLNNYEILCVVTDRKGTKSDNLKLPKRYTDFIADKETGLGAFTDDIRCTKEFDATCEDNKWKLVGISNEHCDDYTDTSIGGGIVTDVEDFYASEENIVVLSQKDYERYKDEEIVLDVVDPYGRYVGSGVGSIIVKVAGYHLGKDDKVFMPFASASYFGAKITGAYSTDIAAFVLNDNSKVQEVYEAAKKMLPKVDPDSYEPGFSLTVQDQVYRATVKKLQQDIKRTGYLLTMISGLGFCAGFLVGFLGTKGETRNYALMRTMGLPGGKLFWTVMFEQQVLSFIACAIVAIITKRPLTAGAFFICHALGTLFAVLKPVFARPTKLLRDQE